MLPHDCPRCQQLAELPPAVDELERVERNLGRPARDRLTDRWFARLHAEDHEGQTAAHG